jgi:hypothetical protein
MELSGVLARSIEGCLMMIQYLGREFFIKSLAKHQKVKYNIVKVK